MSLEEVADRIEEEWYDNPPSPWPRKRQRDAKFRAMFDLRDEMIHRRLVFRPAS